MRKFTFLAFASTFILSAFAQTNTSTSTEVQFVDGADLYGYKTVVTKDQHNGFTLEYKNYYKVLTNTITNKKYCLVGWDQGIPSDCNSQTTFKTPIASIGVESDSYSAIPFIELLNLQSKLNIQSYENVTSPCSTKPNAPINSGIVFSQDPSLYHVSFSGDDDSLAPLQKLSWLLYIAAFFDMEIEAHRVFNQITTNYNCHQSNIGSPSNPKKVSWTYYDPSSHVFTIRGNEYFTQLISDAGGSLQVPNRLQNSTFPNDVESINLLAKNLHGSDFIIDESDPSLPYDTWFAAGGDYFKPESTSPDRVKAIAEDKVYSINGLLKDNKLSDWSQRSAARPDLVLLDMINLLYPDFKIAGVATFPVWLVPFSKVESEHREISQGNYDACANIFESVQSQTACSIGGNAGTQYKKDLNTGGKAGVSVGVILFVIIASLAGIYFYRKYRRNQRHNFYRMNDL